MLKNREFQAHDNAEQVALNSEPSLKSQLDQIKNKIEKIKYENQQLCGSLNDQHQQENNALEKRIAQIKSLSNSLRDFVDEREKFSRWF